MLDIIVVLVAFSRSGYGGSRVGIRCYNKTVIMVLLAAKFRVDVFDRSHSKGG